MNLLYMMQETHVACKYTCARKANSSWAIIRSLCCICRRLISPQLAHQQADCTEEEQQVNAAAGARAQLHPTFSSAHPDWRLMYPSGPRFNSKKQTCCGTFLLSLGGTLDDKRSLISQKQVEITGITVDGSNMYTVGQLEMQPLPKLMRTHAKRSGVNLESQKR